MTLALEINDAGLVLARDGAILAEEPGVAMLDGATPETGAAAARRARLKPLYAETRYWQDLGTEPLARPVPAAANRAEVAYAQLARFVAPHLGDGREVLIAVPPWYTREQLGLLLGVATGSGPRAGRPRRCRASRPRRSSPRPRPCCSSSSALHRAVVTVLDCGERPAPDALRDPAAARLAWRSSRRGWTRSPRRSCSRRGSIRCTRPRPSSALRRPARLARRRARRRQGIDRARVGGRDATRSS